MSSEGCEGESVQGCLLGFVDSRLLPVSSHWLPLCVCVCVCVCVVTWVQLQTDICWQPGLAPPTGSRGEILSFASRGCWHFLAPYHLIPFLFYLDDNYNMVMVRTSHSGLCFCHLTPF